MSRENSGKIGKKKKKNNFSKFSATRTYLKLIFISFFYEPFPYQINLIISDNWIIQIMNWINWKNQINWIN